jgi:RNA polymerase sigma factor (sigma-70 family)
MKNKNVTGGNPNTPKKRKKAKKLESYTYIPAKGKPETINISTFPDDFQEDFSTMISEEAGIARKERERAKQFREQSSTHQRRKNQASSEGKDAITPRGIQYIIDRPTEVEVLRNIRDDELHSAIKKLSSNQQRWLHLHFGLRQSKTEISDAEGVSVAAISQGIKRALIALEKDLAA